MTSAMDAIETLINPAKGIPAIGVRFRGGGGALPDTPSGRIWSGPFIFLTNQAGPAELLTGHVIERQAANRHIGLDTVTYLYRGDFHYYRDSTASTRSSAPAR